ncbi:TetR/AcrR family transcriptional regulator [Effusibacillus lacus]|uniref:TetR family transcriptional regulator n=1 Tax=Effusibacillus lacus TaxID=1348429 RepID=A0A292YLP8_9BACL|nr:TetR/AcrR family transcriptional regulator [Effusibacillus lacus]TCS69500.1 TetR family transcriptional regulator [Effusibacillus lacus]GAX90086.1 TetR family transcriptional regulator [Effusibacillus lacus]
MDKFDDLMAEWLKDMKDEDQMTEKQRRILEASIKLFSEKGFHAASTSEIAREAGVAEGTIFRHFKTKKDILLALVVPTFMKFLTPYVLKDVKRILEDSSVNTKELMHQLFKNRLELIEKNWDKVRILFQEATFHPEIKEALVEHIGRRARGMAEIFIKQKMESGEFRELPVHAVARAAFSMMLGYIAFKHVLFVDEMAEMDDDKEIEVMIDIFLNGVGKKD